MTNKITVLMSTYNGEKFLKKQLDSILSQNSVNLNVLIRDDGSTDRTINILKEYSLNPNIEIIFGKNIGWRNSFFWLLEHCSLEDDRYFAFADQDDIWLPEKLHKGIDLLSKTSGAALYHSNLRIMDDKMVFQKMKYDSDFCPAKELNRAFFDGVGTGATMIFNNELGKCIRKYYPTEETAHDAYVYLLALVLGTVVYDNVSYINYRRHADTATGLSSGTRAKIFVKKLKVYRGAKKHPYSIRATQILEGYENSIDSQSRKFLRKIVDSTSYFKRFSLIFDSEICATKISKTFQIKYRILVNNL